MKYRVDSSSRGIGRRAFTLIELLVVVVILGVLFSIAYPQFQQAGRKGMASACVRNLKEIVSAKERWAMDNNKGAEAQPALSDLIGSDKYLKNTPICPRQGTYDVGSMNVLPTCTIGGVQGTPEAHVLP